MASYVRNLTIRCKDLGVDTTLAVLFAKQDDGSHKDVRPIVWKVTQFGKAGSYSIKDTYVNELAFMKLEVNDGNFTYAATDVSIGMNQKTVLRKAMQHYLFSPPEIIPNANDQPPQVINETGFHEDICLGFKSALEPGAYIPLLVYKAIGQGVPVSAPFKPILQLYATSRYAQGQVVDHITQAPIMEVHLGQLDERTIWELEFDQAEGSYRVAGIDTRHPNY